MLLTAKPGLIGDAFKPRAALGEPAGKEAVSSCLLPGLSLLNRLAGPAEGRPPYHRSRARAGTTARSAASQASAGAPVTGKIASRPSPTNFSTSPPCRSIGGTGQSK